MHRTVVPCACTCCKYTSYSSGFCTDHVRFALYIVVPRLCQSHHHKSINQSINHSLFRHSPCSVNGLASRSFHGLPQVSTRYILYPASSIQFSQILFNVFRVCFRNCAISQAHFSVYPVHYSRPHQKRLMSDAQVLLSFFKSI